MACPSSAHVLRVHFDSTTATMLATPRFSDERTTSSDSSGAKHSAETRERPSSAILEGPDKLLARS